MHAQAAITYVSICLVWRNVVLVIKTIKKVSMICLFVFFFSSFSEKLVMAELYGIMTARPDLVYTSKLAEKDVASKRLKALLQHPCDLDVKAVVGELI